MLRYWRTLLPAAVLAFLLGWGWQWGKARVKDATPIRYVRVEGVFQYLGREQLQQVLRPLVTTDFFSADVGSIHDAALALPWVDGVVVNRVWPDAIDIRVFEQKPVVRWGGSSLLNARGELFRPENIDVFRGLPLLSGPAGSERRLLGIMRRMHAALADHALNLTALEVSGRRSWQLTLDNGMHIKLGRMAPQEKFQLLLKALPVLGQETIDAIARMDLRYPNGFAVAWKAGMEPHWDDAGKLQQRT